MTTTSSPRADESELRRDLAAALRWTAAARSARRNRKPFQRRHRRARVFAKTPAGGIFRGFAPPNCCASISKSRKPTAPIRTAFCLHAGLHRRLPQARCVLHAHSTYATALASLADWRLQPIDQNACRFYNRIAYDDDFGGMLLADEEIDRVAAVLGDKSVLLMRGHGVMTVAASVGEAFDLLYYFERACRNQWLALASGMAPLQIAPAIAEKTARQWEQYPSVSRHLAELREILEIEEPDFLD